MQTLDQALKGTHDLRPVSDVFDLLDNFLRISGTTEIWKSGIADF